MFHDGTRVLELFQKTGLLMSAGLSNVTHVATQKRNSVRNLASCHFLDLLFQLPENHSTIHGALQR